MKAASPGKCGNCLMEAVEIIDLQPDGTCPRCAGNYSKGIAPKSEDQIARTCPLCQKEKPAHQPVCWECSQDNERLKGWTR